MKLKTRAFADTINMQAGPQPRIRAWRWWRGRSGSSHSEQRRFPLPGSRPCLALSPSLETDGSFLGIGFRNLPIDLIRINRGKKAAGISRTDGNDTRGRRPLPSEVQGKTHYVLNRTVGAAFLGLSRSLAAAAHPGLTLALWPRCREAPLPACYAQGWRSLVLVRFPVRAQHPDLTRPDTPGPTGLTAERNEVILHMVGREEGGVPALWALRMTLAF
ncbi:hypothetical protein AAFF_G00141290 [Aldrovandia affinis]|uniref:Uncharacterized protein n=1 Tax=Aldrovandia affinis TaxID=143900 RepID=A0AAD7TCJ8_9TELE|nr:hypothetical protein AAFF_G00141290 [Aldrovandia affinis]